MWGVGIALHAFMSSQTSFCTVPICAHLCLHKTLLLEQLLEGLVAVRTEVNPLALVAVFVENDKIRIVMIYPIHFKELVVLEAFFLPKETAHLRELVELSPRARLEATASRLIRVQLFAYAFLALTIRCASLRLALCPRGGQGAQQHSAHKDSAVPHLQSLSWRPKAQAKINRRTYSLLPSTYIAHMSYSAIVSLNGSHIVCT